jgi:methylmalonyl-CoA mutase N-terminal domain/subunit
VAAGLDVDAFAPRLSFFFNAQMDFLTEVAKFRAARRLYARLMKERFGAKNERSCMLRFHTQTAGSSLTAQEPELNVVRTTLEALAAVFGGTQSLHTNSRDEALGLPTEESAKIALRTQQIIAFESGVAGAADPFGGSYYVEELTDRLESEAREYIARIDAMGGALAGIEAGFQQGQIQNAAYEFQREVETGKRVIVGVNRFQAEGEGSEVPVFRIDPAIEREQVARVVELRGRRDSGLWRRRLDDLEAAARSSENLMPRIVAAAEASATVGEISDTLRSVFGEYLDRG